MARCGSRAKLYELGGVRGEPRRQQQGGLPSVHAEDAAVATRRPTDCEPAAGGRLAEWTIVIAVL